MNEKDKTFGIIESELNNKLVKELEKTDYKLFKFPKIDKKELQIKDIDIKIINEIKTVDWIVFTDITSVDLFLAYLESIDFDLFILDNVRVAAYGEAVADKLRFSQIHSDVIANKIDDKTIFSQIKNYLFEEDELLALDVLIIKEKSAVIKIIDYFESANSNVYDLSFYSFKENVDKSKYITLTKNGAFDAFIFNSPSQVFDLNRYFHPECLVDVFLNVEIYAVDRVTLQTLTEFGFLPKILSKKSG